MFVNKPGALVGLLVLAAVIGFRMYMRYNRKPYNDTYYDDKREKLLAAAYVIKIDTLDYGRELTVQYIIESDTFTESRVFKQDTFRIGSAFLVSKRGNNTTVRWGVPVKVETVED